MEDKKRGEDLETDEIDKEFRISIEGLGIGGDIPPQIFQCGRCLRKSGTGRRRRIKRMVNGSSEAPVSPSYREHHQSRSHVSFFFFCPFSPAPIVLPLNPNLGP